jgi:hypothetical protein
LRGAAAGAGARRLLHDDVPGFGPEACLPKVAAVVQLYGIYLFAVTRMADHVRAVLTGAPGAAPGEPHDDTAPVELVERLAALDGQRHTSFASKFAHFFVHRERFPVYDGLAREVVRWHLGRKAAVADGAHPYGAFTQNLRRLWAAAGLPASTSTDELDRSLWLTGQLRRWERKDPKARPNGEARRLFESEDAAVRADLVALTGHPAPATEGEHWVRERDAPPPAGCARPGRPGGHPDGRAPDGHPAPRRPAGRTGAGRRIIPGRWSPVSVRAPPWRRCATPTAGWWP